MASVLTPGLRNSQHTYANYLEEYINAGERWLDLGCGHQILPEWMPLSDKRAEGLVKRAHLAVGVDVDPISLRKHGQLRHKVRANVTDLPFKEGSFSLATANMVVEHLEDPKGFLQEVHRVLQCEGLLILHTPNLLSYGTLAAFLLPPALKKRLIRYLEGREEEEVFRTFYRLNTKRAIRALAKESGFEVVQLCMVESTPETIMLGPLVVFELLLIRLLRLSVLEAFRSNIVAVLRKPLTWGILKGRRAG